ncbi:hypothetical protein ABEW33_27400 [Priestia megaterium]|uniref:hypothetical protein n=1 Tax=Priestia megaterium TaxID=1404 RepID=UPI0030C9C717
MYKAKIVSAQFIAATNDLIVDYKISTSKNALKKQGTAMWSYTNGKWNLTHRNLHRRMIKPIRKALESVNNVRLPLVTSGFF